jgi:uncharacterized membrane protein
MFTIAKGVAAFISLISSVWSTVTGYLHDKGVKNAQQATDYGANAVAGQKEVNVAQTARDSVTAADNADPGRVRSAADPDAKPYDPNAVG